MLAHQVLVGRYSADGVVVRHDPRRAQLVDDAPEVEVFERSLGKVLALGNLLRLEAALNQRCT